VIISRNVVWNKEEFPGTSKTTLDPVPARFGRPADTEPAPEAPEHEEMEDNSDNAGGAPRRLPGTLNVGLDPGRPGDSSAGSLLSSSSTSEDSEPPPAPVPPAPQTPPRPIVCTAVPATPRPDRRQIEAPTGHCRAPAPAPAPVAAAPELHHSTRSQAGVPLDPTCTATQYLLILGYLCDIGLSCMYLCSDVFDGLVVSRVVSLSSCTKCHVALIM
jgi:hypothetical protein